MSENQMPRAVHLPADPDQPQKLQPLPGWDVLLLALLLFCLLMINGFAESSLGGRFQDVARHPWLGQL